jgi:PqqD family protein of HPr-rel-A system
MTMIIKSNIAISDNGFVFNPSTGDSFTLNKTGIEVLKLIKEGRALNEITRVMQERYDSDSATLERFLSDFINQLLTNNLLEE